MGVSTLLLALSAGVLLAATLADVAYRLVPNWMPATLLLAGAALRLSDGALPWGLAAAGLILFGGALCWRRGWLGGGDVKLLGACGLLVPPAMAPLLLLDVALAGGVLALIYLALARALRPSQGPRSSGPRPSGRLARILRTERRRIGRSGPLPYASAIAAGALLVLLKG